MTKREKLLATIRANPKAIRFEDACKVAERLAFTHRGGQGSHRALARADEPDLLNFQNRGWLFAAVPGAAIDQDDGQIRRRR